METIPKPTQRPIESIHRTGSQTAPFLTPTAPLPRPPAAQALELVVDAGDALRGGGGPLAEDSGAPLALKPLRMVH